MKKLLTLLLLVLTTAPLGALDENRDIKTITPEITSLTSKRLTNSTDLVLKTSLGILYHNAALVQSAKGISGNAPKAIELLESVTKDPKAEESLKLIAMVYLGSSLTLKGNEDQNPILVDTGLTMIDELVTKYDTTTYLPRFFRGNICINLPPFFEKLGQAGDDSKSLEAAAKAKPDRIPAQIQSQNYLNLGNYFKKQKQMKEAMENWQKALNQDKEKLGAGKKAAEYLEAYGD